VIVSRSGASTAVQHREDELEIQRVVFDDED